MNLTQILDASALAVLAAQAGWIGLLYRRMGRLRTSLESAGAVVGQLDAASRRLDDSAGGVVQKVRDGLAEVDSKIGACRRLSQELTTASRHAEEVATRLDQALRQNRKLQSARAAAPPRELVEPIGLAERLAGRPAISHDAIPDALAAALPTPTMFPILDIVAEPELVAASSSEPETEVIMAEPVSLLKTLASMEPPLGSLPPPLGNVLAAELLFAERPVRPFQEPGSDGGPRTIRVKLD
ncbi:hypothetical protein [Teichococcus vastitatis]|uniref:Uncharacterized protein n=1 Tax=Teichococcus vastitatis TaxID=2307076 RepID=A0ABS9W633_9PROT|nr:hypothetical protein [Pseudoroseomonas vastitatis]MCI0754758.1 hypothetical protein [Pseudoroseomonas vastitatis]